jgi:hypothetical protein
MTSLGADFAPGALGRQLLVRFLRRGQASFQRTKPRPVGVCFAARRAIDKKALLPWRRMLASLTGLENLALARAGPMTGLGGNPKTFDPRYDIESGSDLLYCCHCAISGTPGHTTRNRPNFHLECSSFWMRIRFVVSGSHRFRPVA